MVPGWFRHQRALVCDQQGRHEDGRHRYGPHRGGRPAVRPLPFEVSRDLLLQGHATLIRWAC